MASGGLGYEDLTGAVADSMKTGFCVCSRTETLCSKDGASVEILKCAEDDKIPWSNVKLMMDTDAAQQLNPKMKQELWTLTLKGDDIEAYSNRFHELVLMCPELVPTEKKKIEKRPETGRAYAAAPAGGKFYAGNLPKCNRCNLHHHGPCPQKCQRCQRIGHMEKDCRVRLQGAGNDFLQNVTCFGCGEKGTFKGQVSKAG
ncbi:putative reverse transcriptase domain-containing protein [Tanacetum coccineum]